MPRRGRKRSRATPWIGWAVIGLLIVGVFGVQAVRGSALAAEDAAVRQVGVVAQGEVVAVRSRLTISKYSERLYRPVVDTEIDGRTYRYEFTHSETSDEDRYREGAVVLVEYDPSAPHRMVLASEAGVLAREAKVDWVVSGVGAALILVEAGLLVAVLLRARRRAGRSPLR